MANKKKIVSSSEKQDATIFNPPQTFYVVDCCASGHNIRAQPSLKALPVGKLKLGSSFLITEQVRTNHIIYIYSNYMYNWQLNTCELIA